VNWIVKIVVINLAVWVFVFLCVGSTWFLVQAGSTTSTTAHGMSPVVVCVGSLAALLAAAIVTVPFWIVFKRAGAHPALSILMLVPLLNLATLYWVELSKPRLVTLQ
jgi:hypothetical protein